METLCILGHTRGVHVAGQAEATAEHFQVHDTNLLLPVFLTSLHPAIDGYATGGDDDVIRYKRQLLLVQCVIGVHGNVDFRHGVEI